MVKKGIKVNALNKTVFDKAMLYMQVCRKDTFDELTFKDEFELLKILFDELSNTVTNNITEYFIKRCKELNLKYDPYIYMYLFYLIKKYNDYDCCFSETYNKNINDLYYLNDIEAKYNKTRFQLHYRTTILGDINIDNDLDESIVSYVKNNLPNDLDNELELAIAIYVLVCNILQYDGTYFVTGSLDDIAPFEKISCDNPKGVCVQIAIIYYKLLKMYGIDAQLNGSVRRHLNVNLRIGTMMINADPTKEGYYSEIYNMSDLTNVKLGFLPEGIVLLGKFYIDANYIKYNIVRLYDAIRNVYKKMGMSTIKQEQFDYVIDKMQKSEFGLDKKVFKEDIDRRMVMVNSFPLIEYSNVENYQYLSRIVTSIFGDIVENRVENIMLYKYIDGKISIGSLLVVYDEDNIPYYYLLMNGKYVNLNVSDLCYCMIENQWMFKNGADVDALKLKDNELIYKLVV